MSDQNEWIALSVSDITVPICAICEISGFFVTPVFENRRGVRTLLV